MGTLVAFPGMNLMDEAADMTAEQVAKLMDINERARIARQTVYVDTKDTAKLVRAKLKKVFPQTKFGVKISRYSGGSSIDVTWTDGPTTKMVEATCEEFRGDYFDGMIDYHGGIVREVDGNPVKYMGSLGYNRRFSRALHENVATVIRNKYGSAPDVCGAEGHGGIYFNWNHKNRDLAWRLLGETVGDSEGNILGYVKDHDVKFGASNIVREY